MNWETKLLATLREEDNYRTLTTTDGRGAEIGVGGRFYCNMASNDYLGLSGDVGLQREFWEGVDASRFVMSNPSSRLIAGNSAHYDRLEQTLSDVMGRPSLVVGSGYLANCGALPALTGRGDLILADKYVHASVIDGLRLGEAEWTRFNHNDMTHLERLLRKAAGYRRVWVATESIFSMDGDVAPLRELATLKRRYGFRIYLDEAHAFGLRGEGGRGYACGCGVLDDVDVVVATLGKACASAGAFVACDATLRETLINRMRTLIFSTALPPISLMWSDFVVRRLADMDARREHLERLVRTLSDAPEATHIVPIMAGENAHAIEMAEAFRMAGFWVNAIRHPTVPRGKARVRVSLNAGLRLEDVENFRQVWNAIG